jgi:hypothetical protein
MMLVLKTAESRTVRLSTWARSQLPDIRGCRCRAKYEKQELRTFALDWSFLEIARLYFEASPLPVSMATADYSHMRHETTSTTVAFPIVLMYDSQLQYAFIMNETRNFTKLL